VTAGTVFVAGALEAPPAAVARFRRIRPFPWLARRALLAEDFFRRLCAEFPPLERFERHEGVPRGWQRPHDRYYLAYGGSERSRDGTVGHDDLPASWRTLLEHLLDRPYRDYLRAMLGGEPRLRFAWHRSYRGCEVSPHLDSPEKLGTMVFYCNDASDWDSSWGGDTLILGRPRPEAARPDFFDFQTRIPVRAGETQCLLFRTGERSWHGVERLTCPDTHFRKTFHVIAESR
jgi:hypothetical protein